MFWLFIFVAVSFILGGMVIIRLGFESRGRLRLNPYWGMRTSRTMVDEETFARANRAV